MRGRIRRFTENGTEIRTGFSSVSCRGWLDPLYSHRLHPFRLHGSSSIRSIRSSMFIPRTTHRTHPLDVQPFLKNNLSTMASADFSPSQSDILARVTLLAGRQASPGKNVDFLCIPVPFTVSALDCFGLRCHLPTRPTSQPLMGFLFIRSQICFQLPSDLTSQ